MDTPLENGCRLNLGLSVAFNNLDRSVSQDHSFNPNSKTAAHRALGIPHDRLIMWSI